MKLNPNLLLFLPIILLIIFTFPKFNSPQITQEAASDVNQELLDQQQNPGYGTHIVQPGQSLHQISTIYYRNPDGWQKIAQTNNLNNPDLLLIDQELIIPDYQPVGQILTGVSIQAILNDNYEIQPGDTLWYIAERAYGTPYKYTQLALFNNIANPDHIEPGWTIAILREIQ